MNVLTKPGYIAIEGCIGVGKTTLCALLAKRFGALEIFEKVEENPFLAEFYADPETNAFKTQIFFLLSRYKQQVALKQQDLFARSVVSDYFMTKDRVFAELNLSDVEMPLYEQLYQTLCHQVCTPDLVIYLRAPLPVILERIKKRGRPFEMNMDTNYLSRLCLAYEGLFANFTSCPVLTVETEEFNFPERDEDVDYVMSGIFDTLESRKSNHFIRRGESAQPLLF